MSDNEDTSPTAHPPAASTSRLNNSTRTLRSTTRTDDPLDNLLRTPPPSDGAQTPHSKRKRKRRSKSSPPDFARVELLDDVELPSPSKPTRIRVRSNSASLLAPSPPPSPTHPSSAHPPHASALSLVLPNNILEELEACLSSNPDRLKERTSRGSPLAEPSLPADPPPDSPSSVSPNRSQPQHLSTDTPISPVSPQHDSATPLLNIVADPTFTSNVDRSEGSPHQSSPSYSGHSPAVAANLPQDDSSRGSADRPEPQAPPSDVETSSKRARPATGENFLESLSASGESNPWEHSRLIMVTGLGSEGPAPSSILQVSAAASPPTLNPWPSTDGDRDVPTAQLPPVHINANTSGHDAFMKALAPESLATIHQQHPEVLPQGLLPATTVTKIPWALILPDFKTRGVRLANGAYGFVVEAEDEHGRRVAAKGVPCGGHRQPSVTKARREIAVTMLASAAHHPNIVEFIAGIEKPGFCFLILELEVDGSVEKAFRKKGTKVMVGAPLVRFAKQICSALTHLELLGIIHRDIKPANTVLRGKLGALDANYRIVDFGVSFPMDDPLAKALRREEREGTVPFMAPEVLNISLLGDDEGYDFAIDRFSLGAMMLYLATRIVPHGWTQKRGAFDKNLAVLERSGLSDEGKEVIRGLLTEDRHARWTLQQVLEHPWMN